MKPTPERDDVLRATTRRLIVEYLRAELAGAIDPEDSVIALAWDQCENADDLDDEHHVVESELQAIIVAIESAGGRVRPVICSADGDGAVRIATATDDDTVPLFTIGSGDLMSEPDLPSVTRYACPNLGCPKRDPVTATAAPTCYTCGRTMVRCDAAPVVVHPQIEPMLTDGQEADYLANGLGWRRTTPAPAARTGSLYISIHDEIPGERYRCGPELSYPGYRRQRVDRRTDGRWPDRVSLDFAQGTANCVARFFGIQRSETGDHEPLYSDGICPPIYIGIGTTPILTLTLENTAEFEALLELAAFRAARDGRLA